MIEKSVHFRCETARQRRDVVLKLLGSLDHKQRAGRSYPAQEAGQILRVLLVALLLDGAASRFQMAADLFGADVEFLEDDVALPESRLAANPVRPFGIGVVCCLELYAGALHCLAKEGVRR